MFGILYIVLSFLAGKEFAGFLLAEEKSREKRGNQIWLLASASFGIGTLLLTWCVYVAAWFLRVCMDSENPLFYGNLAVMAGTAAGLFFLYFYRIRHKGNLKIQGLIPDRRLLKRSVFCTGFSFFFLCISCFMFFI